MSGWCHKCGHQMCLCEFNEKRPSVAKLQAENERLTARLAEAEAERDAMRDKMYAADAKAAHAKQQRDSIFRVAKVTKQNADGLRAIIRRCVNELEGWRCALAFRSGQTNAGEERVNKLIEDCLDAAPYTVTPADVFGTGEPKQ